MRLCPVCEGSSWTYMEPSSNWVVLTLSLSLPLFLNCTEHTQAGCCSACIGHHGNLE